MVVKLLANGDTVFATLRQPEKLQSLQKKYPETLILVFLELTNPQQIETVVKKAFDCLGYIDFFG